MKNGFNPCFIGTYSITNIDKTRIALDFGVLILVLLELTLLRNSSFINVI